MRRRIAVLVLAGVSVLGGGCAPTVVGGNALPADTSGPAQHDPVPVAALDGLLLETGQINDLIHAGMRLRSSAHTMWDASATFSDKNCLAVEGPAQAAVYADTGWTAMRGQRLDDNFDDPTVRNDSTVQAVIAYPSARQANTYYTAAARRWLACANRRFSDHTPGQPEIGWKVGDAHTLGGTLSTSKAQDDGSGWNCQRALTVRNNIVVDIETCGSFLPGGSAVDLAQQIAAKVVRQ